MWGITLHDLVSWSGAFVELLGVLVLVIGTVAALVLVFVRRRPPEAKSVYAAYRRYLGRAILLGLELLVAADIIRTVSEIPTIERVVVLAVIVLIRTFLSFSLEVELEGRWPWQRESD